MAPKRGAPLGNNHGCKSDNKFFMPYTWATCEKPAAESEEDLKELRVQHRKLYVAGRGLGAGSRKDRVDELLRTMKAKIVVGAQRIGRNTAKSEAIDDAEAEVDAGEEEYTAVAAEMNKHVDQITRAALNIAELQARSQDCFDRRGTAARNAIQAALELQWGDTDEELPVPSQAVAPAAAPSAAAQAAAVAAPRPGQCAAFTKRGSRCSLRAVPGSDRCSRHRSSEPDGAAGDAEPDPCPAAADGTQRDEDLGDHGIAVAPVSEVADNHAAAYDSPAGSPNHNDDAKEDAARWRLPEDVELVRDDQEGEANATALGSGEPAEGSDTEPEDVAPCSVATSTADPAPKRRRRNAPKSKSKTKPTPVTPGRFLNFTMPASEEYDEEYKGEIVQAGDDGVYTVQCPDLGDENIRVWRSPCDELYFGEKMK